MTSVPLEVFEELTEERHARAGLTPAVPGAASAPAAHAADAADAVDLAAVRAVAFDLDATLVDFIGMKRRQCREAARAMRRAGLPGHTDQVAEALWDACLEHGIDWDGVIEIFLIDHLGHVDADVADAGNAAWERVEAQVAPFPKVRETLRALQARGLRLALVTDAPAHKAHQRLAATGLGAHFDHVITAADHPRGKGTAAPFRDLLQRWGLQPHEVAMVGDNPTRDVRHARRLGMPTVLARYGLQPAFASDLPEDQAHAAVDAPHHLLPLLTGDADQTLMAPHDYPSGRLTAWCA